MVLEYTGDDCSASDNEQGKKASCSGGAPGTPVDLVATGKDAGKLIIAPEMDVITGQTVTFTGSEGPLKASTGFDVIGAGGTQSIEMHTSFSQPLNLGDRFGSMVVFAMDRTDDQVDPGPIASGISLAPGEMTIVFDTRTLFSTTVNVATVTGEQNGQVCQEANDSVEVIVTAPPAGPYECDKPMKRLAMLWDGLQDVRVVVWKCAVGSTQLADFPLVAPGDVVEVGGFTTAPSNVKIGESVFHLSCSNSDMNGVEDCGRNEGNGKENDPGLINDWRLEEITDSGGKLDCTPDPLAAGPMIPCGLGFELALILPPLAYAWTRRRRRNAA